MLFLVTNLISLLVRPPLIAVGFSLCLQVGRGCWSLSHGWVEVAAACPRVRIKSQRNDRGTNGRRGWVRDKESRPAPGTGGTTRFVRNRGHAVPNLAWPGPPSRPWWTVSKVRGIMRQARATLTCGSPRVGDGVVRWWSKAAWKVSAKVSWGQILLCLSCQAPGQKVRN